LTLEKLRADKPLCHADIKAIEADIKLWLALNHVDCDLIAACNGVLRYLMLEPKSTLEEAYESLPNTFGDAQFRVTPERVNPRGRKTPRHYSTAKD
jgi:hypothetical protein